MPRVLVASWGLNRCKSPFRAFFLTRNVGMATLTNSDFREGQTRCRVRRHKLLDAQARNRLSPWAPPPPASPGRPKPCYFHLSTVSANSLSIPAAAAPCSNRPSGCSHWVTLASDPPGLPGGFGVGPRCHGKVLWGLASTCLPASCGPPLPVLLGPTAPCLLISRTAARCSLPQHGAILPSH